MLSKTWVTLAFSVSLVVAQDFSIPSGWAAHTVSQSDDTLKTMANNLIGTLSVDGNNGGVQGIGYWQSANWISGMANFDHFSGTQTHKTAVTNALNGAFSSYSNYDQYGWWATAAYYGYRAYGDQNLLNHAVATWSHVSNYVITDAIASSGSMSGKSFKVAGTCGGQSMAGGVFWRPTADATAVNSITTGLYMALSAFLGDATGDAKYTNAADLSANWIHTVNTNANQLVLDTVDGESCTRSAAGWVFTYNTGKFIEGLSVLSQKKTNWQTPLLNTIVAATKSSPWQGANAVITEGASDPSDNDSVGFKPVLIRGLHEAWARNSGNANLRSLVKAYTDVQWNALQNVKNANNPWYSSNWAAGSRPSQVIPWGQLAAIDVLVSATNEN
ncbi:endo-1,6-alpha-mannosidase [Coniophora puteana RWD-64-598 SS2]|uniref:Endo-1,6-alpha-mannosidase n=1 Tax=Coniophora puteana (strain RWD-64-598) TaxID=741705 RepID=A0A5M3MIL3_CONPW|nr:endo-1,6-alpha-mannosidase [Coniophora puteana RWD-64-598 SS2]EIW78461.1 endo-1,6-alpha-mannosidase [Coniophora puteana RWD-64-598 SS2]